MIKRNTENLLNRLPAGIQIVAATKARNPEVIKEAIKAGIKIIGENYVQEAEAKYNVLGRVVQWHFIGHLQKNKVKRAVEIFDMIQTIDSFEIAQAIDKACSLKKKVMQVLIEVNSAREKEKFGLFPQDVCSFIEEARQLKNIKINGLMTMGPFLKDASQLRPYFKEARRLFERVKSLNLPGVQMCYLSMGMSDSYQVAVEEGANLIRIGTAIFGRRKT
ncbi:MAG: YggS family pyridoxal phosphate-dependent enzyme [Candidatus Omnitrophota bacterium]|nr:YggS family pyridoxal phosphate-dependent enzyme [Candidatus Omnitrophota bacterium]MBU1871405.1 YggS family pyridoxal phosphate-dependent enzyme [Candidatus Omnitrophota bacterium]